MAYGLKYKLDYCDINSNPLRLEILERDYSGIVYMIEGSEEPFILQVNNDKGDKSGYFQSTSADISIFADEHFNIDNLLSNDETQLRVDFYKSNVLAWTGFVVPDFFDEEISSVKIVNLTASDRLGTLKSATLEDLSEMVTIQSLLSQSLAKTGLSLPLNTNVTFIRDRGTTVLSSNILSQRLKDTKGRDVSCYDIIKSICVLTNSFITQQGGEWYLQNKLQHEAKIVNRTFSDIHTSGRRTIQPVGADVSVFQEFGGGRLHPENYDFSKAFSGWETSGAFLSAIEHNALLGYQRTNNVWYSVLNENTDVHMLEIKSSWEGASTNLNLAKYLKSTFPIITSNENKVNVILEMSFTGMPLRTARIVILAKKGDKVLALNPQSGALETFHPQAYIEGTTAPKFQIRTRLPPGIDDSENDIYEAVSRLRTFNFSIEDTDITDYEVEVRIYGTDSYNARVIPMYVNFISLKFEDGAESPKGNIYKTAQGANYSKAHDTDTTIFGDYLTSGLNGYFYDYPSDDTSSILKSNGTKTSKWTSYGDEEELPILQHSVRQRARMFSSAHNILKISFETEFNHLDIFGACTTEKYIFVSGEYQFRKRLLSATIEEVKVSLLDKRDYIYSYFGGSDEKSVSSVGGVSGGTSSGGGGGGMTSEQLEMLTNLADWWKLDEENDAIYSEKSVYSLKGVSALGLGSEGGGSGGGVDRLDSWANYTEAKANYYVPASFLVPFRNDTLSRLASLEAGGGATEIDIATTGTGNAITSLTKSGSVITVNKGLTFSLSNHNHNTLYKPIGYAPTWGEVTGKPSTFAPSAHTHTIANITGLQGALDLKASQSDINTAIDNLEIGGRNLVVNSEVLIMSSESIDHDYYSFTLKNKAGDNPSLFIVKHDPNVENYTLSFKSNTNNIAVTRVYYWSEKPTNSHVANRIGWGTNLISGSKLIIPNNPDIKYIGVGINGNSLTDDDYLPMRFWDWKLEKGTKATDWTPAPEDQVSDWLTTDVNSFSYIKNKPTKLSDFTDNIGVATHIANTSNPHSVTKAQVGLGNVDNTSDLLKPISNAVQTALNLKANLASPTFTGNVTAPTFIGALTGNASSATKLQTARTIAGVSFDGTANIAIPFANLASKPNTLGGYEITDGVTLNTAQTITGAKTFSSLLTASAGINTPKVDFGNGFTIEPSGTELVFKYSGVIKQRMLSDGTILATGGITALSTE